MNRGGKLDHSTTLPIEFCRIFAQILAKISSKGEALEGLLKKPPGVIRYPVSFTKDIPELLDRAGELGLEGLIGKRAGSRYEAGTIAALPASMTEDKGVLCLRLSFALDNRDWQQAEQLLDKLKDGEDDGTLPMQRYRFPSVVIPFCLLDSREKNPMQSPALLRRERD